MTDEHFANGTRIISKENRYGAKKDYVEVPIGTSRVVVPRRIMNPETRRREDLTRLSDDGYLKHFLALWWYFNERKSGVIDLDHAPVLSFADEHYDYRPLEDHHIIVKHKPESRFEELVLGDGR